MTLKKTVSLLLALLLAAGTFVSCSEKREDDPAAAKEEPAVSEPSPETAEEPAETEFDRAHVPDNLPELDFGGADVIVHVRGDKDTVGELVREELTGEAVNDAVFERNNLVNQKLNVKIGAFEGPGWREYRSALTKLRAAILSGDGSYDMVAGYSAFIPSLSLSGVFLNLNKLDYFDLHKQWWNQSIVSDLQIAGKLYFLTGDISLTLLTSMYTLAFNRTVAEDNQVEDLYAVVREHRWTLDYVYDLTSKLYADLNGNGSADEDDGYGLATNCENAADAFMQGARVSMISRDDEDLPVLDADKERLDTLVSKVYHLYFENPGCLTTSGGDNCLTNISGFVNDRSLLAAIWMSDVSGFAEMESDYGLLPFPLLDESQAQYGTRVQDGASIWSIPICAKDPGMSAAVMEALAAQSWRTVTPAYFDVVLKYRYSRDPETSEMVDLIKDSIQLNFEIVYNDSIGDPWFLLRELMKKRSNNFASYWARKESQIQKSLGKAVDKIRGLDD